MSAATVAALDLLALAKLELAELRRYAKREDEWLRHEIRAAADRLEARIHREEARRAK